MRSFNFKPEVKCYDVSIYYLNDDTEITHSEKLPNRKVKVYIETPDEKDGFHNAICYLPDYEWENNGYSEEEMTYFKNFVLNNAHLMISFAEEDGFDNASNI